MRKMRKAAALKYDNGYEAPVVTAAGMGFVADKIIETAHENNVPIIEDEQLVEMMNKVDVGDSIPFELYDVVAKVIAYVMDVDQIVNSR